MHDGGISVMSYNQNGIKAMIFLHKTNNPIRSKQIELDYNISGPQIREIVKELRREGYDICTTGEKGGYYVADEPKDVLEGIQDLEKRVSSMNKTIAMWKKNSKVLNAAKELNPLFNQNFE